MTATPRTLPWALGPGAAALSLTFSPPVRAFAGTRLGLLHVPLDDEEAGRLTATVRRLADSLPEPELVEIIDWSDILATREERALALSTYRLITDPDVDRTSRGDSSPLEEEILGLIVRRAALIDPDLDGAPSWYGSSAWLEYSDTMDEVALPGQPLYPFRGCLPQITEPVRLPDGTESSLLILPSYETETVTE